MTAKKSTAKRKKAPAKTAQEREEAKVERQEAKAEKQAVSDVEGLKEIPVDPREDTMAREGGFVQIVSGEHEGRYGVLISAPSVDNCVVRTRDDDSERLVVAYKDLRPADAGGR